MNHDGVWCGECDWPVPNTCEDDLPFNCPRCNYRIERPKRDVACRSCVPYGSHMLEKGERCEMFDQVTE